MESESCPNCNAPHYQIRGTFRHNNRRLKKLVEGYKCLVCKHRWRVVDDEQYNH